MQGDAIQLESLSHYFISEIGGDLPFQRFQRLVLEFHDLAIAHVDDVMVMTVSVFGSFKTRTSVSEIVALQYLGLFEQTDGPVYRRHADTVIDLDGALMKFLGIGMIVGIGKNLGDHPPLTGHLQALVFAEPFDA